MWGHERVGDHGDSGAQARQQRQHADGLATTSRRRLLDVERGRHPHDEHLEADGEQLQEGEVGERRREGAAEVDEREAGDAHGEEPATTEAVGEGREGQRPQGSEREDRTEPGEGGDVGLVVGGDGGQGEDEDRALVAGEHHGDARPDQGDALPAVELDHCAYSRGYP